MLREEEEESETLGMSESQVVAGLSGLLFGEQGRGGIVEEDNALYRICTFLTLETLSPMQEKVGE